MSGILYTLTLLVISVITVLLQTTVLPVLGIHYLVCNTHYTQYNIHESKGRL